MPALRGNPFGRVISHAESHRDHLLMWLLPFVTRLHVGDLRGLPQQDSIPWALLKQLTHANRSQFDALIPPISLDMWRASEQYTDGWHGRPIRLTWEILARLARRLGQVPLSYEVVWCLCTYHVQARASTQPAMPPPHDAWRVVTIPIATPANTGWYIGVRNERTHQLLAFRRGTPRDEARATQTVLYEALLSTRLWRQPFPERLIVPMIPPPEFLSACGEMGIPVAIDAAVPNPYAGWDDDLGERRRSEANLAACFAAYLRTHGYGQVTTQYHESLTRWFLTSHSEISEPTYQHPILRSLLRKVPCRIGNDAIVYHGLHYVDSSGFPLLSLFAEECVVVRPSLHTQAIAWVEWEEGLLTCVVAREFRRRDGSLAVDWHDADASTESS